MIRILIFLLFIATTASAQQQTGEIPLEASRFYQVSSTTPSLREMTDNDINTYPPPRYGWIVYPSEIWYEFPDELQPVINEVRFYDGMGTAEGRPFKVFFIAPGSWQRIPAAVFDGEGYNEWTAVRLDTPVKAKYMVIEKGELFPNELKLFGSYNTYTEKPLPPKKYYPFSYYLGVNGFEWNILTDPSSRENFGKVDTSKLRLAKALTAYRHYMDWDKVEHTPGNYTFSPTRSGAWDYDTLYQTLKQQNIEVLVCFKTIPDFIGNTYPEKDRDYGNPPIRYGDDLTKPASYIEQGRAAYQFMARYGYNKNATAKVDTIPQWGPGSAANSVKTGMGLIRYIECDNERDKWWRGRIAYQTGREYAANLSAFYDGDQGRLGPGVGVKAADPGCKVVIGGIAAAEPDYVRAIIDWCKEFRGGDLCFDVINYHHYANNGGSIQYGDATSGVAPEAGGLEAIADTFLHMSERYAAGREVWMTESGYDIHQSSPQKVPPADGKSILETQADWILRTSLLYARTGIARLFFYQLFDDDAGKPCRFCTTGLADEQARKRRPALDYLVQANSLISDFRYKRSLSKAPFVDEYVLNNRIIYVLYVSKGRMRYTLPVKTQQSIVYYPTPGADQLRQEQQNGTLTLELTETPLFVEVLR